MGLTLRLRQHLLISPRVLRFGCDRKHETYENIRRNGKVVVSLIAPPDVAVSIKGHARIAKERMDLVNTDAVIEVEVEEVKDDLIPGSFIVSGILYSTEKHVYSAVQTMPRGLLGRSRLRKSFNREVLRCPS